MKFSHQVRQTQDGPISSNDSLTSRQRLIWDLIQHAAKQNLVAPSEVLRLASTGELVVSLPNELRQHLRSEFHRKALNPMFGSWLMGWISTWVIAEPHASSALATASWRRRQALHLSCLLGEPGSLNNENKDAA